MQSKSKPVRLLFAVAGSATILAGGLPLLTPDKFDWIGPAVGLLGLVISGGVTIYTEQATTPWEDVAVKATPTGRLVAGPAAENIPNGAGVQVRGVGGQLVPGSATIGAGLDRPQRGEDGGPVETWQEGGTL
jgi:hypothetical protein